MTDDPDKTTAADAPSPSAGGAEAPEAAAPSAAERTPARSAAYAFKKDLVLKTAASLFFRDGYTRTRIADIAAALGVTPPFIYYHFPSKLDLLTAICAQTSVMSADLAEAALSPEAGPDPLVRFRRFVRAMSQRVIEEREFLSILFVEGKHLPPEIFERLRADRQRFARALHQLMEEGRAAGAFRYENASIANQTVTGMVTWPFNWFSPDGPESPEQVADRLETMVLAALGVPWEVAAAREDDPAGPMGPQGPGPSRNETLDDSRHGNMLAASKT
ncbi:TetR/AcrR family transcriptional regulator [Albimonas sp. CAU 1670]|uniref:TetR/AcrR family transcriptional regulator n=1 Tax=Albimonas sp. CAU 1670 TaxID=3032599 RepID=UPI0023DCCAE5|nr:TetR/AcrR family transcriptional regulator [Albimonas sp. CAU 1670]MDF2233975.1 TetR/AcrR family transcriptional regulator [Albimonas sp. CAU 1670]